MATRQAADERREIFIREYLIDRNGTRAAIAAGYSPKTAGQKAYMLLQEPDVRERVNEATKRLLRNADITAERVLMELARIAFSDVRALYDEQGRLKPIHELNDDQAAAITAVDVEEQYAIPKLGESQADADRRIEARVLKIRRADKVQTLGLLARFFKMIGTETDDTINKGDAIAARMERALARYKRMTGAK